jgi:23S rRNA (cytidine1920-2'-O)/16S rRNA (cytidine1409-2'-O)-methyltransferase
MVAPDEPVHLVAAPEPFVSRAGRKLDGALDVFAVDVSGVRAVDVGASTGGFTDCLLQRGARSVTAIDVGYGQLHWKIRSDDRVTIVERLNVREADPDALGGPFDLVVADLSFISLSTVAGALASLGSDDAAWVLLIKPQFEAGRDRVQRGGLVTDPSVRRDVLSRVLADLERVGLGCQGLAVSSIAGTKGNVEFVGLFTRQPRTVGEDRIATVSEEHPG